VKFTLAWPNEKKLAGETKGGATVAAAKAVPFK